MEGLQHIFNRSSRKRGNNGEAICNKAISQDFQELKINMKLQVKNTPQEGSSLAVQCLRLCGSNAGGTGSTPSWETKIPHAAWCGQKVKNNLNTPQEYTAYIKTIYSSIIIEPHKIKDKEEIF